MKGTGNSPDASEQCSALIDAYAHELAERQRAWAREPRLPVRIDHSQLPSIVEAVVDLTADLIDPEVSGE